MKERREPPLFKAVKSGDINAVRSLLAEGEDLYVKVLYETVLFHSIFNEHHQITEMLLQYDPSIVDSSINYAEDRPLHLAVRTNDMHTVRLLLSYNADLTLINKRNRAPLHEAVRNEHPDMISLLIDNGADVNMPEDSLSPLHISAICGNMSLVQLLLENGANIVAVTRSGSTVRDLCEKRDPSDVQEFDQAVLAAQRTISENILIVSKVLEYSSQLAGLPYLANCFDLIGGYVGGYGKRLDSGILGELAGMAASQVAPISEERKVSKRKQCADSVWVAVKSRKEAVEEVSANDSNVDESYSSSSSDARDSHPGGDGISTSSSSYSADQSPDQQQSMESDRPLSTALGQRQFIYEEAVDAKESGEALLMKLFVWVQDLSDALRQRILGLFTELLEALEQHDEFLTDQLSTRPIEDKFEADSRNYYEQDSYLDALQEDYARAGQTDSIVSFSDDVETITMSGAVVNSLHKHDLRSDALYFLAGTAS